MNRDNVLVMGPSCAGKSTFIESRLRGDRNNTVMAYDLATPVDGLRGKIIHYNSLRVLEEERK